MKVLVTGATGYIGGRLIPRLLERGHEIRVLVRNPVQIEGRRWAGQVEVAHGDLLDPQSLEGVFDGIDAAYYLVHSMYAGNDFVEQDRRAAENFCRAAAGLRHVIYLGGLVPRTKKVRARKDSMHLHSRAEVGRILAKHLPATELRAGPIIGSGSASFELLRYLTERMPIIVAPAWALNDIQPIAVRSVLWYLIIALDRDPCGVVEVGCERMTYRQMMQTYARIRRLKRLVFAVPPFLPVWLGAGFVGALTPIPTALVAPLVQGMMQPLVARQRRARRFFPEVEPIPYEQAVRLALQRIREQAVETRWSGAMLGAGSCVCSSSEGLIREVRTVHVDAHPDELFDVFASLGGDRGWLSWNWAWRARGFIDRLIGGPGLRRGRRHPQELLPGEAVDFWRVEMVTPPRTLRLRAEMKLPGRAWLEWEASPSRGGTQLVQTAAFAPRGLGGTLYWYLLYPFHRMIFTGLIRAICRRARRGKSVSVVSTQPDGADQVRPIDVEPLDRMDHVAERPIADSSGQ